MKRWIVVDKENNVFVSDFVKNKRFIRTSENKDDVFIFNWEHEAESAISLFKEYGVYDFCVVEINISGIKYFNDENYIEVLNHKEK